jgi:hypothetical protein
MLIPTMISITEIIEAILQPKHGGLGPGQGGSGSPILPAFATDEVSGKAEVSKALLLDAVGLVR